MKNSLQIKPPMCLYMFTLEGSDKTQALKNFRRNTAPISEEKTTFQAITFPPTSTNSVDIKTKKVDLEELYSFSIESTSPAPRHQGDFTLGRGSKS